MQAEPAFRALADRYFDQAYFKYQPTQGTLAGFHQYDQQLEKFDRPGIALEVATLHDFEREVSAFPQTGLNQETLADWKLL